MPSGTRARRQSIRVQRFRDKGEGDASGGGGQRRAEDTSADGLTRAEPSEQ
jgi:hypothetical protein